MNKVQTQLTPVEAKAVAFAAELASSLSLARSIGQIYALLYVSEDPLSTEELCAKLGISKGNASINLRTLEQWEAVEKKWVRGSRRAHYAASRDLRGIALKRLSEGAGRRVALARGRLDELEASLGGRDRAMRGRLKEFRGFLDAVERGLSLLPKLGGLSKLL